MGRNTPYMIAERFGILISGLFLKNYNPTWAGQWPYAHEYLYILPFFSMKKQAEENCF